MWNNINVFLTFGGLNIIFCVWKKKPISPEHANYVKYVTIQNKVIVLKKDSNLDDFKY